MMFRPTLLAVLLSLSSPTFAEDPAATPAPTAPTPDAKEQASLRSFGVAHPDCKEWNDGCATCKRDDAMSCSTPGIACQPVDIVCKTP